MQPRMLHSQALPGGMTQTHALAQKSFAVGGAANGKTLNELKRQVVAAVG